MPNYPTFRISPSKMEAWALRKAGLIDDREFGDRLTGGVQWTEDMRIGAAIHRALHRGDPDGAIQKVGLRTYEVHVPFRHTSIGKVQDPLEKGVREYRFKKQVFDEITRTLFIFTGRIDLGLEQYVVDYKCFEALKGRPQQSVEKSWHWRTYLLCLDAKTFVFRSIPYEVWAQAGAPRINCLAPLDMYISIDRSIADMIRHAQGLVDMARSLGVLGALR